MSYLQLDIRVLDQAHAVATLAGLPSARDLIGGLSLVWAHCWREKVDEIEVEWILAHFGVPPGPAGKQLMDALALGGFVAAVPGGRWRVRGAEKRLGLLRARQKGAQKARGGEPPQPQVAPITPPEALPEPPPAPPPEPPKERPPMKTAQEVVSRLLATFQRPEPGENDAGVEQHEAHHSGPDDSGDGRTPAALSTQRTAPAEEEAGQGDESPGSEHQQLVAALCASYQRLKHAKYAFTGRDAKALVKLKTMGPPLEIVARWEQALQTQGYRGCTAIYELPDKWNAHPMEWVGPPEDFDQRPTNEKKKAIR